MPSEYLTAIPGNITASPGPLTVTSKSNSASSRARESSACHSPFEPSRCSYSTQTAENERPNANTYTTTPILNQPTTDEAESRSIADARTQALYTLSVCRNVIASLEVTRIWKSRVGFIHWRAFWYQVYARPYGRLITRRVALARLQIEELFRFIARYFQRLTQHTEESMRRFQSEDPIWESMRILEITVVMWRHRRRKRAQEILNAMRSSLESIPIIVTDELFIDMKRGVFALDAVCDYHPGDPQAEARERRFDLHVYPCGSLRMVFSPGWYHEWQNGVVRRFLHEVRCDYARRANVDIGENWFNDYMASDDESSSGNDEVRIEDGAPVEGTG